ncbi:MAG: flavin reductase family protein [Oscillospiraceae bacterium]|nr:flavin reductase family protein [Oscillospiraceae bacterium]
MFYEPEKNNHGLKRPPFKSCTVPRAIGWISTLSVDGVANLAPYSQFTNLTFDPPYVLVSINQGYRQNRKDTTENIEQTGEFVYNMVTYDLREAMNITAAEFMPDVDEFEAAGLTKAPSVLVKAPRVAESPIQFECKYVQTIRLPGEGRCGTCDIIIGKVVGVHIKDEFIDENDKVDIVKIKPLARLGYSDYTTVDHSFEMEPSKAAGIRDDLALGLEGAARTMGKIK